MYKLLAHVFLVSTAVFIPYVSCIPNTSPDSARLAWQCLPPGTALFSDLACSLNGTSYLVSNRGLSNHAASVPQPIRTTDSGPWSYEPICTAAIEEIGSKICVYTDLEFSNGRGISIITTPELAEKFAALPSFQDRAALDKLLVTGNVDITPEMPGRGRIALARHDLESGTSVSSNVPIIVSAQALDDFFSLPEREEVLRAAVLRLPIATQRLLARLTWETDEELLIYGYFDHHAGFPVEVGAHRHYALFPELSYFNHACAPNSHISIDASTMRTTVRAARDIPQGEEITFSYFFPNARDFHFLPLAPRQQAIRSRFSWTCSCPRCSAGSHADEGLELLLKQQQALESWTHTVTPHDALRLIRSYKQQGLDTFLYIPYRIAALVYNAVGDAEQARLYAELSVEMVEFAGSDRDEGFEVCMDLLRDTRGHWSWRVFDE